MALPLELPVLQNWACRSCGECCKRHLVEITDDERTRILSQDWEHDADLRGVSTVVPLSRWSKRWRLNHTADGSCVFLQADGLCRIHAKHGENAKPLACRVYPYAFHPAGKKITVSVRYSCPSVVLNHGPAIASNEREVRRLAKAVVPERHHAGRVPAVSPGNALDWADFLKLRDTLERSFADPAPGFLRNLLSAMFWVTLVGQSSFARIRGPRLDEFLSLIVPAAAAQVPQDLGEFVAPTNVGRMLFRLLVGQYARLETTADLNRPWTARRRNVTGLMRMARGQGDLPAFRPELKPVPFTALETPFGWPAAADELFSRYLRTKIHGLHFCGPAYYNVPFVEGFFALANVVPVTLYLARWLAAGDGRTAISDDDLRTALAMADHHHGYSPLLAGAAVRTCVRTLAKGDLPKLCVWYAK